MIGFKERKRIKKIVKRAEAFWEFKSQKCIYCGCWQCARALYEGIGWICAKCFKDRETGV